MKGVPGVMQLESNACAASRGASPAASAAASASSASRLDLKRRARCWFIFARGATPSTAMNITFCGCTMWKSLSR